MKALAIRRYKAPMEMMEVPRPEPGPGELLVRVRAAGVNPLDYKIRDGAVKVLLPFSFPLILGTDLAGDVEAIGPGVTKFKLGDAVYSRLDNDRIGAFAEYALVRESAAARKPARLNYTRAWGMSLQLVWILEFQNRKVDRLARERRVRFEYLFMRASGEQLEQLGALVEQGVIKPVLDKIFPLEAGGDAISYVEYGRAVGKVVIRIADYKLAPCFVR